jgi:hypothetical protein
LQETDIQRTKILILSQVFLVEIKLVEAPPQRVTLKLCYILSDKFDLSYELYNES